jgi:hypothetical protein
MLGLQEEKVNQIIADGVPWTDPDFGPTASSIATPGVDKSKDFSKLTWKRASEIFSNCCVFSGGIEPNDIN